MSVEVYSECSVQLFPPDGYHRIFNRCLIELRQYDVGEYALRIIDLENNKAVRFKMMSFIYDLTFQIGTT